LLCEVRALGFRPDLEDDSTRIRSTPSNNWWAPQGVVAARDTVDAGRRHEGIGREMVEHARPAYGKRSLTAETDHEAVGFYERCGFAIQSLGELYPGVERFQCTLGEPILSMRTYDQE
jgi:hypothetical protein